MKICLFNRDGANLWLEKGSYLEPHIYEWHLKVDDEHDWVLKYLRIIGNYPTEIEAVDPSGGPFISVGNTFVQYSFICSLVIPACSPNFEHISIYSSMETLSTNSPSL